jgi:hypothetical protein
LQPAAPRGRASISRRKRRKRRIPCNPAEHALREIIMRAQRIAESAEDPG